MADQKQKTVLTPFIASQEERPFSSTQKMVVKAKKPGAHLSKEEATREVLNRIVQKVKRI
ncbi:MAG: hypothetical protein WEC37_02655 [Anaerolineales bacterium]